MMGMGNSKMGERNFNMEKNENTQQKKGRKTVQNGHFEN